MIPIAVIGYGYWGPNWARVLRESPYFEVVAVADTRRERLAEAKMLGFPVTESSDVAMEQAEAVVVATPLSTHYNLVFEALERECHVVCAKPLAENHRRAAELREEAVYRKRVLLVDHTYLYTGAVRKLRELVGRHDVGGPVYIDSVRVNLGLFQHDCDVVWDLAPHDLSIWDSLIGKAPEAVAAVGMAPIRGGGAEIARLTCWYPDRLIAHAHLTWLSPVKVRRMLIGCEHKMIVYDDIEPTEKIKVYDAGVRDRGTDEAVREALVDYRMGDVVAPKLDNREALAEEAEHFALCILGKSEPFTDASQAVRVIRTLRAASLSLAAGGVRVGV